mmetsp:Transcript_24880/g.31217  ORF Transcript_24880/g.31217 Transcript_24880/m.31217 type:complete len:187 (-) Transcript_24880:36-596(-)
MAAIGLCQLAGQPISPSPREPLSRKVKQKMLQDLKKREARREFGSHALPEQCDWLDFLSPELEYLITEVWRARCAVTNRKLERRPLALARWWRSARPFFSDGTTEERQSLPLVLVDELILLAPHLAERLDSALNIAAAQAQSRQSSADDTQQALFQAAANALGGEQQARRIDNRLQYMRVISCKGS